MSTAEFIRVKCTANLRSCHVGRWSDCSWYLTACRYTVHILLGVTKTFTIEYPAPVRHEVEPFSSLRNAYFNFNFRMATPRVS